MKTKIFNKIRQEFFTVKNIADSCETIEQLECCNNWLNNLNTNWVAIADEYYNTLHFYKKKKFYEDYKELTNSLVDEWQAKITELQGVLCPVVDEQLYKSPVVVRGFQHTDRMEIK